MRRWLDHPRARMVAMAVLALLLITTGMQMHRRASRPGGYDFTSYLLSARALAEGDNPYATKTDFPYLYPLTLATLLIPLSYLPYALANGFWFLLNVGALWIAIHLIANTAVEAGAIPSGRSRLPAITLMLILTYNLLQNHFLNGQVNLIVLLCMLLFQAAYTRGQRFRASLSLAFAIALKIMPGLLLLLLLVRRKWMMLAYTLLATAGLVLLPYLWRGTELWNYYAQYLDAFWIDRLLMPATVAQPRVAYSLGAVIARFGGPTRALQIAGTILVLATLLWIEIRDRREVQGRIGLYLLAMLLISPMSETHHLVFLLPSLIMLGLWLYGGEQTLPASTRWLYLLALGALLGGGLGKSGPLICLSLLLLGVSQRQASQHIALSQ